MAAASDELSAESAPGGKLRSHWFNDIKNVAIFRQKKDAALSAHDKTQDYLVGVRGFLVIQSFLWVFLQTFVPATVKGSANTTGPAYQLALRKSLSVLFWNDSLIYSSIILLSARTTCLPFLLNPEKIVVASSAFRRGLRLWFPTAAALVICYIAFSKNLGAQYLFDFANATSNYSMHADIYTMPNSLANFNSIFNIFWVPYNFSYQAGNWAFPTQTLWIVTALFQQSYTVFTAMLIAPYTRASWRVKGCIIFISTAFWVYSWAWFSITGLLLADAVVNMDFGTRSKIPLKIGPVSIPKWTLYILLMVAGFAMQFTWATARPDLANAELQYHTGLYSTGGLYTWNDVNAPQLRSDNYLVILGFFLLLDTYEWVQRLFNNAMFLYLGRRSFSYFLIQSIIVYTLGIKLFMHMTTNPSYNTANARGASFVACLATTIVAAEAFYRLVDRPSQAFARMVFDWIRE
ncbi:hypothetical protein LTR66_008951 [Elasticomyces elasticus]|nr:hypothetical protein LTR66_008951 [Elasticomyces elasticus]